MLNHEENHRKVCCICWRKASRIIFEPEIARVKKFVVENYDKTDTHFPQGLCNTCRTVLLAYDQEDFRLSLQISDDFSPHMDIHTRSLTKCLCRICKIMCDTLGKETYIHEQSQNSQHRRVQIGNLYPLCWEFCDCS